MTSRTRPSEVQPPSPQITADHCLPSLPPPSLTMLSQDEQPTFWTLVVITKASVGTRASHCVLLLKLDLGSSFCCGLDWTQPSLNLHCCPCSRPAGSALKASAPSGWGWGAYSLLQIGLSLLLASPVPTLPTGAWPLPLSPSPALPAALQTHLPEL